MNHEEYYEMLMSEKIKKDDLIKFIVDEFDRSNNYSEAQISRLTFQFVNNTFQIEKPEEFNKTWFNDGSIL